MRMKHAGGRVVSVSRDSWPVRGEKMPRKVEVDAYEYRGHIVASAPVLDTPKLQTFEIAEGPDGDALLAALRRQGPAKVRLSGDAWLIDIDRIERS